MGPHLRLRGNSHVYITGKQLKASRWQGPVPGPNETALAARKTLLPPPKTLTMLIVLVILKVIAVIIIVVVVGITIVY